MLIFRICYSIVILSLVGVILYTDGYLRGHDEGYFSAMFDVAVGGRSAHEYMMERYRESIKIPRRSIKN